MSLEVREVDTRDAPEALLREMHEFYIPLSEEELPGDPPMPYERRKANWRQIRSDQSIPRWLLRSDGAIVASAVAWMNLEQNVENGFGSIYVSPLHRGNGYARKLAQPLFDRLAGMGRVRFDTYVKDGRDEERLCERLGLKSAIREKRSRLDVSDVDMDMMRLWIDKAEERASDYELLALQDPFPDEHLEKFCELQFQMNTAPLDDYEMDDEVMTPKMWRESEQQSARSFHDLSTYVAVHKPSGGFVGSTTIQTDQLQPDQAWQWETVVHPEHRNQGLGRLLKASMIERVVAEYPEVDRIDTWNAGSNEPMLNINIAMGYRPIQVNHTFQGDLATARERMGA